MAQLLTAEQMRAVERSAIDSGSVTGRDLMERAGRGVVEAVFEHWPDLARAPHRAAVLCGPGNNGGDGFVVARLLKSWGWEVSVWLFGDPQKLPPDAAANYRLWHGIDTTTPYAESGAGVFTPHDDTALIVDALFGTGLTRPVEGFDTFARATRAGRARVVAVDMPSGLCSDSGRYLRRSEPLDESLRIRADLTVSFHAEKLGHRLDEGPEACGCVVVKDIGLSQTSVPDAVTLSTPPEGLAKSGRHKFAHGHALVLTGEAGRTGAARLAARAALRVGAGLVTLGTPPAAQQEVACQITALMLRRVEDGVGLNNLLEDDRLNALCLGPGLGLTGEKAELVEVALASGRAAVLDADALTLIGHDPELFSQLHGRCVLTPHDGEFARLFPDIAERLRAPPASGPAFSRADAARQAAARCGAVVLLKGADTVIAAPDGACRLNSAAYDRSVPWLATAGAGDVLAGLVAGLLARGVTPFHASRGAAWLHVACALQVGPGLIAEDLPEALPEVLGVLAR
ncbi:NAD(P)H-hydrate dehydratase [Roseovarius salis]|uniref:NAD(P)H-hydrate dehydratase n=1 Tax=Roseovarius salis TaxID=3376063 RepID=UPI0037C87BAF